MAAFTVIDHTEIGAGGAASWTKSSIPTTYDHLLLEASIRSEYALNVYSTMVLTFNADTGNNYSETNLYGTGTSAASNRGSGNPAINSVVISAGGATADTFGTATWMIPNYANTTGFKQVLMSSVCENASASAWAWLLKNSAGLWSSTAAVNQITITGGDASDIAEFSTFTLYGITGA